MPERSRKRIATLLIEQNEDEKHKDYFWIGFFVSHTVATGLSK